MQSQINYLTAIISAGLTHKVVPDVDLSKADWEKLIPFIEANHLQSIVMHAFSTLRKHGQPLPDRQIVFKLETDTLGNDAQRIKRQFAITKFSRQWRAEGKCPLALGGLAFSVFYPSYAHRGGDTFLCIPLHQKAAEESADTQDENIQTCVEGDLKVIVPDSAVGTFGSHRDNEADAILRSAFYAAPCQLHPVLEVAYPVPGFLALYHLYTAQQLLLNATLPFEMVLDWGALLHAIGKMDGEKFNWANFIEQVTDLGLLAFVQSFTTLAVRLTGITLPEAAASLTAADEDVDYLLDCILAASATPDAATTGTPAEGRFARFIGVLRNSKKYSRFSTSSPLSEAFRYLFK